MRSSRSCCPSRLSRPHPWSWQSHPDRWIPIQQQSGWTPASISSHSPLLWSASCRGCQDRGQGGLVRWRHLWLSRWTQNDFPPLTFTATASNRAKWGVHWLPESGSSGRVGSTSYWVNVTLATAAVGNKWRLLSATIDIVIVAILGSIRCNTEMARSWRQRRTIWTIRISTRQDYPDSMQIVLWWLLSQCCNNDDDDCDGDDNDDEF